MDLVLTIIGSTALTSIILYVSRATIVEVLRAKIKSEYDLKLESYRAELLASGAKQLEVQRAQLKGEADVAQERLRSQLSVQAAQDNVTFTRLHERRVSAIESTYRLLHELQSPVSLYLLVGPSDRPMFDSVIEAHAKFNQALVEQQLFLPKPIASALHKIELDFVHTLNHFNHLVHGRVEGPDSAEWLVTLDAFDKEVLRAIEAVEDEMRLALGDRSLSVEAVSVQAAAI